MFILSLLLTANPAGACERTRTVAVPGGTCTTTQSFHRTWLGTRVLDATVTVCSAGAPPLDTVAGRLAAEARTMTAVQGQQGTR